jgi:hypothetical protein
MSVIIGRTMLESILLVLSMNLILNMRNQKKKLEDNLEK